MNKKLTKTSLALATIALGALLAGCGSGSDSGTTVNGDVPIAYVERSSDLDINPTDGAPYANGGNLIMRRVSSASSSETNITGKITAPGNNNGSGGGDVSDPEASYDGKKIVFTMNCPTTNTAHIDGDPDPVCTGHWNIWEYDTVANKLRRVIPYADSRAFDDVDPAYLPAGGFVFSSNRQQAKFSDKGTPHTYAALDEYERETVLNIHTMAADGTDIVAISSNQSHDRNPIVELDGDIVFSRWEHVGDRNRFAIFKVKPDGTTMFTHYGAQSPGNSFLHPREMDPNGPYRGKLVSSLMPLSRTQEGGALMLLDVENYSENDAPAKAGLAAGGGQRQISAGDINEERGLSLNGRYTTPYPLWDGTNRILVAYHPCTVRKNGSIVPCATLTSQDIIDLNAARGRTNAQNVNAAVQDNAPAVYAIYVVNPADGSKIPIASPPDGKMFTDPIALLPRTAPEPKARRTAPANPTLAANKQGILEVGSVYDTDRLGRMSNDMMALADLPAGANCPTTTSGGVTRPVAIAMKNVTPSGTETRTSVADLERLKSPLDPTFTCSPARFIRVTRAVAPRSRVTGMRGSIGETEFEQQQILGYAQLEPDGSFKIKVPSDTPIALSVIDTKGRAIQTHTNWIQVRPGETRTCFGCHSPRRGASLNRDSVATAMPAGLAPALVSQHTPGATMASTRTPQGQDLTVDPAFTDVWVDPVTATQRPAITVKYTGNASPADDLVLNPATQATVLADLANGIINYPQVIQQIWDRPRTDLGGNNTTCTSCHNDPAKELDLSGTTAGTGRLQSYEELVMGDPKIGGNGMPETRLEEGVPVVVRDAALVETSSSFASSAGGARKSRLTEIMFGEILKAGNDAALVHPDPVSPAPVHSTMLNLAEKRVLAEWMDLGGQYFNNPFDAAAGVAATSLSEDTFAAQVQPILRQNCMSACHMAIGSDAGTQFGHQNRFVLTGSTEGDFNVSLSMISNVCAPAGNLLLSRPSTMPHPAGAAGQRPLVPGDTRYQTIFNWISSGC